MRRVALWRVDAFTTRPFAGNPAGVVLDADGLSEAELRGIAAEVAAPETAFLQAPRAPGGAPRLRWLTPTGVEVTFCGHATVAAVHVLREGGRLPGPAVAFDTLGGPLRAEVEARPDGPLVWLEPALPVCRPLPGPPADVRDALGLATGSVAAWAPVVTTPERDLVVPLTGLDVLLGLSPDHARLAAATRGAGLRGVCLVSRQVREPGAAIHSRFLAPGVGIPEDPVTGSVHASLAVWLDGAGLLEPGAPRVTFRAEQGDAVGRPGRLLVEVWRAGGRPARVRVGGQAVTVLTGHVLLP